MTLFLNMISSTFMLFWLVAAVPKLRTQKSGPVYSTMEKHTLTTSNIITSAVPLNATSRISKNISWVCTGLGRDNFIAFEIPGSEMTKRQDLSSLSLRFPNFNRMSLCSMNTFVPASSVISEVAVPLLVISLRLRAGR